MLVFPRDAPREGLRPWRCIQAVITIASVRLMCVGFPPAIPAPVAHSATAGKVLVNLRSVHKQLSQSIISMFCDEGVLYTVADIPRQTRLRTSIGYLEVSIRNDSTTVYLSLHQWEWPGRCPSRSRGL